MQEGETRTTEAPETLEAIYDEREDRWLIIEKDSDPADGRYITFESPVPVRR